MITPTDAALSLAKIRAICADADLIAAARKITEEHMRLQRAAEIRAHNRAIDRASEIIADWIANSRDEITLFDRLQDLKVWTI